MGQYHYIVNLSKKEFLNPKKFGDGLKLLEFGMSSCGTLTALTVLLSNSRNRGGGDLHSDDTEYYGRWAGDFIVIAGDYAEITDEGESGPLDAHGEYINVYNQCSSGLFKDISAEIARVITDAGEDIRFK